MKTFAFPTDAQMNLLDLAKGYYNITEVPAVVIDGKGVVFEGLTDQYKIRSYLNCKTE